MVQWLGLQAPTAGVMGSIPGPGTKIPQATQCSQKKTQNKIEKLTQVGITTIILDVITRNGLKNRDVFQSIHFVHDRAVT